jgi:translation initiation factor IF-2
VSNGTLKISDIVVAGTSYGRIKAMFNERNQRIEKAGPAEPAIILGLNGAPTAGDSFHVMETEQEARDITNKRVQLQREQSLRTTTKLGLDELSHRIALGEFHELNIIVKGDTDGSIEALSDSFLKLSTEKVQVNVINKAVGQISENDVMLASASDAIIVGFQVRPSSDARKLADREGVEINTYSIIYDAIDDVKAAMVGMLDKVKKEVITGQVEVKQVFKISKVGTIAGGLVTEGKVHAKDKARVVRDGIVIRTAPIAALKRYKDDVKEVPMGMECGISLVNYNDILEGDVIETFTEIEVEQKL